MSVEESVPAKAGVVALVGRPNAGKSTLMNRLLSEKVAIVSNKPQTTRHRLVGILSEERGQIVFYDTPGVHKPVHQMNRNMIKAAQEAMNDAQVLCLLVDASQPPGAGDRFMLEWIKDARVPRIALLNKVDAVAKPKLLPRIAEYAATGLFEEIVPISAKTGDGLELVLEMLFGRIPAGGPIYDPDLLTIHPERFMVAERIREKVLEQTLEELPFSTAVLIDSWREREDGLLVIQATILAEKEGQKKILIGAGGAKIKAIGTAARQDLEAYLERRIHLELNVRLEDRWRENRRLLHQLESAPYEVRLDEES
jgi:GTPase